MNDIGAVICFVVGALLLLTGRYAQSRGGAGRTNTLLDVVPARHRGAGLVAVGIVCWAFGVVALISAS